MLKKMIQERNLPCVSGNKSISAKEWPDRRKEILGILSSNIYGVCPDKPSLFSYTVNSCNDSAYAGKAVEKNIKLSAEINKQIFSFPVNVFIPIEIKNPVPIVYIAFRPDLPDKYLPVEEIIDNGFAIATFCYQDVAKDHDDGYEFGLAGILKKEGPRPSDDTGKIMMWAWAASRVLDYLEAEKETDYINAAVMGHSRLGKTALVAAAYDERFKFCFPNNSGCSGDSITRGKLGEHVVNITKNFPYWFCPEYTKYVNKEDEMPFDQHFLLASIAPRFVCGAGAVEDTWADPDSQYLCYIAADEVYKLLGREGFIHPDRMPEPGDVFHEGTMGYHLRKGRHFHSRYDWNRYMEFINKHLEGK